MFWAAMSHILYNQTWNLKCGQESVIFFFNLAVPYTDNTSETKGVRKPATDCEFLHSVCLLIIPSFPST